MSYASELILDELLVLKCRRGDAQAWRQLVERYDRRLLYFIRRLIGQERDAYDVLQQTWLAALGAMPNLSEPRHLRTWLYRIARNQAVSHLRRGGREPQLMDPADLHAVADDAVEEADLGRHSPAELHAGLAQLSLPHREALTLHFLEGLSLEEIAEIAGVPRGTIKSRLFHARRGLREILDRQERP